MNRVVEVFLVFLRLGLTSFGGPTAHIGFFHEAFVRKLKWLDEETYANTLALCQFLPGPASSQMGFSVGLMRAGLAGAAAAWIGFTLPSAIIMIGFGLGMMHYAPSANEPWLQGLKVAVIAVVAKAVCTMAPKLCPDLPRILMAVGGTAAMLLINQAWGQVAVIAVGGSLGALIFRGSEASAQLNPVKVKGWGICLALFFVLLVVLPLMAHLTQKSGLAFFSGFFRAGSLVFGGGHVVLPLLQNFVVPNGWVDNDTFMAGYGTAQALPGPLFTFGAYLGTVSGGPFGGIPGGIIALIAIFLPSWLLVLGALPLWQRLRGNPAFAGAVKGANAAVVGILLAAFVNPVWVNGVEHWRHAVLASVLFALMMIMKLPSWAVVVLAAGVGYIMF